MMTEDIAMTAGFDLQSNQSLREKLSLFALLIEQKRTRQLIDVFQIFSQSELRECAQACRAAGHAQAADLLLARASALVVNADALTISSLRMGKTGADVAA